MAAIKEIKAEVKHREWAEQIRECQSSGQTVKEWCSNAGIKSSTYYHRLKTVREEILSRQPKLPEIVPVSVSAELTEIGAEPVLPKKAFFSDDPKSAEKIIIRKDGIEIEMPCDPDENIITAMLRGLREC